MSRETRFNPKASNGSHTGIVQWDDTRFGRLKEYAAAQEKDPYDFVLQLNFSYVEAKQRHAIAQLKETNSPKEAAVIWETVIENSGGQGLSARQQNAIDFYNDHKDEPVPNGVSSTRPKMVPNPRTERALTLKTK